MFIASVTAFALLIGVVYLVRATPLYTASTQVLLEQHEKAPGLDAASTMAASTMIRMWRTSLPSCDPTRCCEGLS